MGSEGGGVDLGLGVLMLEREEKNPIQVEDIKTDYRAVPSGGVKSSAIN